jgi:hypothetical protein
MGRKRISEKDKQIGVAFHHAKDRARKQNLPFNVTLKYLRENAGDECPVFHTPFDWGASGLGPGKFKPNGPQLDRIEPELGYVMGNVAFISHRANRLKDNGTMQDHYDIADWIWSHLYAKPNSTPPIPKRTNLKGIVHHESRAVLATGPGQDDYDPHHHCGADARKDADHRPQTSSGDSMGHGSKEVGTPQAPQSVQNNGQPDPAIEELLRECGHISN